MLDELQKMILSLIGLPCWGVVAGRGTGSNVCLYFGEKIKRKSLLRNCMVSDVVREFDSEFYVYIDDADWFFDAESGISTSSTEVDSGEISLLKGLVGLKVTCASLCADDFELRIFFQGNAVFRVLLAQHGLYNQPMTYSVANLRRVISVERGGISSCARSW